MWLNVVCLQSPPVGHARALYEYTRQTDEELSFPEEAKLEVFDTSDPDWILIGYGGEYGFAPANYIELGDGEGHGQEQDDEPPPPSLPQRRAVVEDADDNLTSPPLPARNVPSEPSSPAVANPAAALANVMGGRRSVSQPQPQPPPALTLPPRPQQSYAGETEEEKSPPLPTRPRGESLNSSVERVYRPVPAVQSPRGDHYADSPQTARMAPGGFHMYNINEMFSVMGKKKKMPTTLGINLKTGAILIAPERAADGPSQEWTADRITHYSREGKHVFMELVRPSKSVDFHAGAKDTAEEIVSALGELVGAVRAEGLREVIAAGTGQHQKTGKMLYDFMAQSGDEVSVAIDDEVIILDDTKSEEWWQVRRLKTGKEGVVPSSYVEITGTIPHEPSRSGVNAGRSFAEQNRLEEERLTKDAVKAARREDQQERGKRNSTAEVGPGMRLPERSSSLSANVSNISGHQQRNSKRENGRSEASGSSKKTSKWQLPSNLQSLNQWLIEATEPDPAKVRTWTDRSKSFSVDAQFLGLKDGKLNLHKLNGVKIAVPISKMSLEDLEYVERMTGISLDEDKPLSDLKKRSDAARASTSSRVGASVEPQSRKPEYDWFQFFLTCDVAVGLCERYAQAFSRDSIDESVLPDVDSSVLRNLGLKEGDIIKVMRYLDNKYRRNKKDGDDGEGGGGLFSGPGGTLRNNTRKGRPAPAVATSNTVDLDAFSLKKDATGESKSSPTAASPPARAPTASASTRKAAGGFDDNAWDVKPSKTPEPAPVQVPAATAPAKPVVPQLTGAMHELSLLTQPLEPTKLQPLVASPTLNLPPAQPLQAQATAPAAQIPQPTGASPAFFTGMQPPVVNGAAAARQRPLAPQYTQGQGSLMPPPPARPLSAPQSAQPSAFTPPPLQPHMTGQPNMYQQPGQQMAPPGQSIAEINQARMQQQYAQMQQQQGMNMMPQPTGMMGFPGGMQQPQPTGFQQPQQTGFGQPPSQFQPGMMNAPQQFGMMPQPTGFQQPQQSGFPGQQQQQPQQTGFQPQPTGFGQPQQQPFMPQPTGINSFLPAPLEPQRTAVPGTGHFAQGFGNAPGMQPLVPQQTGPPPPVRFGVSETKKIAPQPTGRRANLAQASKSPTSEQL